jgi:CRP-like cAMP-binding protein
MADDPLFQRFGRSYPAGYVLFEEGDTGEEMYIIQEGKVRIIKRVDQGEKLLAIIPAGEFFGEMAILLNEPRSATAIVEEDAKLLVIDATTFETMVKSNGEIAYRIIKKLAQRLKETNAQIEMLSYKDANRKVVYAFVRGVEKGREIPGRGILVQLTPGDVAGLTGLDVTKVNEILKKLVEAKLLLPHEEGYIVPDVNRLHKFLEFLAMKEQFGAFS